MILQSTFPDWTPCFSQLRPGFSFPRIALHFHDRFLARDAHRVALAVTPRDIYLTPGGTWKLGGFGFACASPPGGAAPCEYFKAGGEVPRFPPAPDLRYAAPELTGAGGALAYRASPAADAFALGCVAYELFAGARDDGSAEPLLDVRDNSAATHAYRCAHALHGPGGKLAPGGPALARVPESLRAALSGLLAADPRARLDPSAFLQGPFFTTGPIRTLRVVERMLELEHAKQAEILAQLPPMLAPFPPRILRDMVLPPLTQVSRNPALAPFVLPSLLTVAEKLDSVAAFTRHVEPVLAPMLAVRRPPRETSPS